MEHVVYWFYKRFSGEDIDDTRLRLMAVPVEGVRTLL